MLFVLRLRRNTGPERGFHTLDRAECDRQQLGGTQGAVTGGHPCPLMRDAVDAYELLVQWAESSLFFQNFADEFSVFLLTLRVVSFCQTGVLGQLFLYHWLVCFLFGRVYKFK